MANTKLKLLYIMDYFMKYTDEDNTVTANDLIEILDRDYGIMAERKGVYADINTLIDFGMDIIQNKGKNPGYYLASREFELPELKLLVDAVQSSKFITQKKSSQLIKKLETLTSRDNAGQLQRQVYISNRLKTDNESIFINVDAIHSAILSDKQITFQYAEYASTGKLRLRRDGQLYKVSPWALTWDDECYYMVAYEEQNDGTEGIIKHYRVDKMRKIEVCSTSRKGKAEFKNFDLGVFAKKTFGMFGGHDETVTLECKEHLAGVVIDRFGNTANIRALGDGSFRARVDVTVSPQFFGWLTGIGPDMKITAPESVRQEYIAYLTSILNS